MKLINPSYEILDQNPGLEGILEMITRVGYTCYKTEKEITPEVAKAFVDETGWEHFFNLRALDKTGTAHPSVKELALPLYKDFIDRGFIEAPKTEE